jgi:hypothetical protein
VAIYLLEITILGPNTEAPPFAAMAQINNPPIVATEAPKAYHKYLWYLVGWTSINGVNSMM